MPGGPPQASFAPAPAPQAEAFGAPALKSESEGAISSERRPVSTQPEIKPSKVDLRNYFPETWLFDLVELNSAGETTLNLNAPHTITTWVAEAICTDPLNGMQVSEKANLLVTQDFFADLNLPYSIKRGEIFPLNISVFNTVEQNLPIKLTVQESKEYKLGRPSHAICLRPDDNHIETFAMKAKELNQINITVEAKISSSDKEGCNDQIGNANGYTDVIQKGILVKPEGFPVEKVESEFVCRKTGDDTTTINMSALTPVSYTHLTLPTNREV